MRDCIECNLSTSRYSSTISDDSDSDNNNTQTVSSLPTKLDVKSCESSCIQYLQEKTKHKKYQILKNVFIKTPKSYKKNLYRDNKKQPIIISTNDIEDGLSTEFDAVVLKQEGDNLSIMEVWEAKVTLSPSSIIDAISKKFRSVEVMTDTDTNTLCMPTPLGNQNINTNNQIQYGIFGIDLLSPRRAAIQLKNIECSRLLSSDVNTVLRAIEKGYVIIDVCDIMQKLDMIRHYLNNDIQVIVHGSCDCSNYSCGVIELIDL